MSCASTELLTRLERGDLGEGRARDLQSHVAECAGCAEKLRRIGGARAALRAIAELPPPPPTTAASARLEAALRWNRAEPARRTILSSLLAVLVRVDGGLRLSVAGGLSVAVLLIAGLAFARIQLHRRSAPSAPSLAVATVARTPVVAAPPSDEIGAVITLATDGVRLARDEKESIRLDLKSTLRRGDRVLVPSNGRLGFQWGEGSGVLLDGTSELTLNRLAQKSQELFLAGGQVAVRVGPHQPGESLQVLTPDHVVTVHGTWFVVRVVPGGTEVQVLEGVVGVAAREGHGSSTMLASPSRAFFPRGRGVAESERPLSGKEAQALRQSSEMGLLAVNGLPAAASLGAPGSVALGSLDGLSGLFDTTGLLDIGVEPAGALVVDGVNFGTTPLWLRRPRGRHFVEISRPGFATLRTWLSVENETGELHTALKVEAGKLITTPPEPEEFQQILRSRRRQISACYEHSLKRDPSLAGTVTLEISVGAAGQVLGTRVEDDTLKEAQVIQCLRHEAAGWAFAHARNAKVLYPFVFRAP